MEYLDKKCCQLLAQTLNRGSAPGPDPHSCSPTVNDLLPPMINADNQFRYFKEATVPHALTARCNPSATHQT